MDPRMPQRAAVASLSIGWPVGSFVGGRMLLRTGYRATLLLGSVHPALVLLIVFA